jgi:ribose/xylose/arabinose/galactoside ABC-type transport system permease subunit
MMRGGVGAWFKESAPQWGLLLAAVALNLWLSPTFLSVVVQGDRLFGGLIDVLTRGAPVVLLALGMALVIATRGVDLSVGAVMAISSAVAATLVNAGLPWPAALALALAAGAACGAWNGILVAWMGVEPIVATLILMVAGRGVAQLITKGQIVTFVDPALSWMGSGALFGLPAPAVIAAIVLVLLLVLTRRTALGLLIEAVGVNRSASRLAGIRVLAILFSVYLASGLLAGLAGVVAAADIRAADANNVGLWLELDAILAVVVGGGSLFGGRFSLSRTILGALALQGLKTAILRAGLRPEFNLVVMAFAVALVLCLQSPTTQATLARARRRLGAAR